MYLSKIHELKKFHFPPMIMFLIGQKCQKKAISFVILS